MERKQQRNPETRRNATKCDEATKRRNATKRRSNQAASKEGKINYCKWDILFACVYVVYLCSVFCLLFVVCCLFPLCLLIVVLGGGVIMVVVR